MNLNLLHTILQTQSHSRETQKMTRVIARWAERLGGTVEIHEGNVYVTKGKADLYPCMVAHTDTVHSIIPVQEYVMCHKDRTYFAWNRVKKEHTGIGGDDKVGIFITLSMLEHYDVFKAAFFRDEEIGCQGAAVAKVDFFDDCAFILECDRQGKDDFVETIYGTQLASLAFRDAVGPIIKQFGYHFSHGAMTDVYELKSKGVNLCVANMSCGYFNPHSPKEFIDRDVIQNTFNMCVAIYDQLANKRWEHQGHRRHIGQHWNSWDSDEYQYDRPYRGHNGSQVYRPRTETQRTHSHNRAPATVRTTTIRAAAIKESAAPTCPDCGDKGTIGLDETCGLFYCLVCMDYVAWSSVTI